MEWSVEERDVFCRLQEIISALYLIILQAILSKLFSVLYYQMDQEQPRSLWSGVQVS